MNHLRWHYVVHHDDVCGEALTLRPIIDGEDLLSGGPRSSRGVDPNLLLPPFSAVLLPTAAGHTALVGACSCGELGCGSLSVRITRDAGTVSWDPDPDAPYETITRPYRFALTPYLDALDEAAANSPPSEGRGRRVARLVRRRIGLHAFTNEPHPIAELGGDRVDWVGAWPWSSDDVTASVTVLGEQRLVDVAPRPGQTDEHVAAQVTPRSDGPCSPATSGDVSGASASPGPARGRRR